jgi:hypothetical protein
LRKCWNDGNFGQAAEQRPSYFVFLIVATLALFFGAAAALPRTLLTLGFFTVVGTVVVVVLLGIAPTRQPARSAAFVFEAQRGTANSGAGYPLAIASSAVTSRSDQGFKAAHAT